MPIKRRDLKPVVQWRWAQLIEVGLPRSLAARVARDERYDLHDLIELVNHGCAPVLAVRILEPIEDMAQHDPVGKPSLPRRWSET
jgi:hypothetical protein